MLQKSHTMKLVMVWLNVLFLCAVLNIPNRPIQHYIAVTTAYIQLRIIEYLIHTNRCLSFYRGHSFAYNNSWDNGDPCLSDGAGR